jgi:hypothetical protein
MLLMRAGRVFLAGAVILAACSSGGPTNPGGGTPEPGPLTGTWVVSLGEMTGSNAFCRFPSMAVTLTETGTSLAGVYESYGKGICVVDGEAYAGAILTGSVTGSVTDSTLQLTPNTPNFHLTAVVRGDSLVGSLTRTVGLTGGPVSSVAVTGTWRAARLPTNLPAGAAAFIQVQPDLLMISQEDSLRPVTTVRDSARRGISVQPPVTLTVLDPAVVSISAGGWILATTHSALFTVAARSGSAYAEAVGAVLRRPARMVITPQPLLIHRMRDAQLIVKVLDYDGVQLTAAPLAFTSANASIASVGLAGLVTSRGPLGKVAIKVTSGSLTDSIIATIVAIPVSMSLTQPTAILPGDSLQLQVTAIDSVGLLIDAPTVSYASDQPSIIAVSGTGMATAVGPEGFATITATLGPVTRVTRILARNKPSPAIVATTHFPGMPYGLAISSAGAMYVGDVQGFGVYRGDLPGHDFPLRIPLGGEVLAVAFDPTGSRAFIARDSLSRVMVLDVTTNQAVDSIVTPVMEVPVAVGVSPDGRILVVGTSSSLRVYNAHTLELLGSIPATGFTNHLAFHPTKNVVYATGDQSVMEVDLATVTVSRIFGQTATSGRPQGIAVAPGGAELYISSEAGTVTAYDLTTGAIEFSSPGGGFGLAVSVSQDLIFAVGATLDVFDRRSLVPIAHLPVTGFPHIVAVDAAGTTAIVTNLNGWVDFVQ